MFKTKSPELFVKIVKVRSHGNVSVRTWLFEFSGILNVFVY